MPELLCAKECPFNRLCGNQLRDQKSSCRSNVKTDIPRAKYFNFQTRVSVLVISDENKAIASILSGDYRTL